MSLKENSYQVIIGNSILHTLKNEIEKNNLNRNIMVVADENVMKYHPKEIKQILNGSTGKINYYPLKPGETSKSFVQLNKIYSFLLNRGYGRDALIIGIGGGVTGDLVGYAASTFMRGVQLIHVPTTLLAAVDSAIGGKTGINFEKKKNMIGSFYQPRLVVIDTNFFKSLPKREQTSGIGEIIKYGYLSDKAFFNFLNDNIGMIYNFDREIIDEVIKQCVSIKASVVSKDEKESGIRKILNLGHTFAHGFETDLNFKIKHGEAVIAGIISALYLSENLGILGHAKLEELLSLPKKIKMPEFFRNFSVKNVMEIMKHDKKNKNGKIKFVLPSDVGNLLLDIEAKDSIIKDSLLKMKKDLNY